MTEVHHERQGSLLPESLRKIGRRILRQFEAGKHRQTEDLLDEETRRNRTRKPTPRLVVFISDLPRSREAKMAYGLVEQGWQVVLLHRSPPTFDSGKYFREVHGYRTPEEALRLSLKFAPTAYHVFSCWNFDVAELLVRKKPGQVVFDDYDVLTGMIRQEFLESRLPGQSSKETFCMEHADGVCCRGLEVQHLKRHCGVEFRGKRIFFADYCWDQDESIHDTDTQRLKNPSVVFCGGVMNNPGTDRGGDGDFLSVGEAFVQGGVDFHLFPAFPQNGVPAEEFYREYVEADERLPGFHFHHPLPADQLIRGMSGHTAGIHLAGMNIDQSDDNPANAPVRKYYASTNKIFDYLDAGLPTVICDAKLQRWLACRYGSGKPATRELLTRPREFLADLPRYAARVTAARHAYSVRRQAGRLVNFYESLHRDRNNLSKTSRQTPSQERTERREECPR